MFMDGWMDWARDLGNKKRGVYITEKGFYEIVYYIQYIHIFSSESNLLCSILIYFIF